MNPTTLKHDASDARVATTAGRGLAELIGRERAKGTAADPTWLRHAEASQAEWEGQARNANAALMRQIADAPAGPPTWGQAFTASAAWRNRTGYVTTAARLDGYLEERSAPLIPGSGRAAAALAPIAARCGAIPAGPGAATVIRWVNRCARPSRPRATSRPPPGRPRQPRRSSRPPSDPGCP